MWPIHTHYPLFIHLQLNVELLQPRYNGYTAMHDSGPVKLYNPFSVIKALESNKLLNFWVETGKINETIRKSQSTSCTGRYNLLSQSLWRAGQGFRDNLNLLLTQKSVKLVMDEHVNYLRCLTIPFFCGSVQWLTTSHSFDAISDSGLWGLLYSTGYLTIESVSDRGVVCVRTIFVIRAHVSIV